MTGSYQHSEVFAKLKSIKEDIDQNLTSFQYLTTLDYFIESSIDPIVTAMPVMADTYFAKVVAWQSHKPSIKFSRINKHDLPVLLFNSITTDGAKKRQFQKDMLLNRGLLFGLITTFQHTVNNYRKLHDPTYRISAMKRKMLLALAESRVGNGYLYSSVRQSDYWAEKAFAFKELIVQKYTRLALMSAKHTYVDISYHMPLNDVIQTYLVFLSKAIDRCDARQGVLTTFIQTWFYSAKAEVVRKASEDSKNSSYDDLLDSGLPAVDPDTSYEDVQHLCHVAQTIDTEGVLRYSLGIPEFYPKHLLDKIQLSIPHNHPKERR